MPWVHASPIIAIMAYHQLVVKFTNVMLIAIAMSPTKLVVERKQTIAVNI
jgi:hypothetical protein